MKENKNMQHRPQYIVHTRTHKYIYIYEINEKKQNEWKAKEANET